MARTPRPPVAPADLPPHREGQTTPQTERGPTPAQPHERDESSASQQGEPTEVMRRAHDDIRRGVVDTSRGEATDATYRRELRSPTPSGSPPPVDPARPRSPRR